MSAAHREAGRAIVGEDIRHGHSPPAETCICAVWMTWIEALCTEAKISLRRVQMWFAIRVGFERRGMEHIVSMAGDIYLGYGWPSCKWAMEFNRVVRTAVPTRRTRLRIAVSTKRKNRGRQRSLRSDIATQSCMRPWRPIEVQRSIQPADAENTLAGPPMHTNAQRSSLDIRYLGGQPRILCFR